MCIDLKGRFPRFVLDKVTLFDDGIFHSILMTFKFSGIYIGYDRVHELPEKIL